MGAESIFDHIIVLLFITLLIAVVFRRLRIPVVLGYILAGIVVGPHGLGILADSQRTQHVAEFGIVFLMFAIGLEFSFNKLSAMRSSVFLFGGLQVLITTTIAALVGMWLGMNMTMSLIIAGIIALSSTAVVIKQLGDQTELRTPHGSYSVGVLLFQDLAVIPMLIMIPNLAEPDAKLLFLEFGSAIVKGIGAFVLIIAIGRLVLRRLFQEIAVQRYLELFTIAVLLVVLGSAWMTEHLGLSLTLGAFLAGMMLSETTFKHQIEAEIRPFRDILLGLFFVSVGMLVDLHIFKDAWPWVLLTFAALVIFKTTLIFTLGMVLKKGVVSSFRTGLCLAQGGEFGFAMLLLAIKDGLLPPDYGQVVLGSLVLSMAVSVFIIRYNLTLTKLFFPKQVMAPQLKKIIACESIETETRNFNQHVIICGFGRVGQNIAAVLDEQGYNYQALDLDPVHVNAARLAGRHVIYSDATQHQVLQAVGVDRARALIISFSNRNAAIKILQTLKANNITVPVLVRSYDDSCLDELLKNGATSVVPEVQESSLLLASHALRILGSSVEDIDRMLSHIRSKHYHFLQQVFPGEEEFELVEAAEAEKELHAVALLDDAGVIDRKIGDIDFAELAVEITEVRRPGQESIPATPELVLLPGDVLVLFGNARELERAEAILLETRKA